MENAQRDFPLSRYPIPSALNTFLSIVQAGGSLGLLYIGARAQSPLVFVAACAAFAFLMQMGFSLIHEAEHNKLHRVRFANDALGILLAAMFPGSYQFMKVAHLSHHRKNRSDSELVDYVRPGETAIGKAAQYYFLILGGIWIGVPLLSVVIASTPTLGSKPKKRKTAEAEEKTAAQLYLEFVREAEPWRVRAELLFVAFFWWSTISLLRLDLRTLAVFYAAFAFSWASQQYIYHIRTPRHLVEGAYDLRLWAPLRLLYLNFNYHLTHHRAVRLPWIYAHQFARTPPTRGYWKTYLELWAPPESIEKAWPRRFQTTGALPERLSIRQK